MTAETGLSTARLLASVEQARDHIERERFRGWDPFDALASPLFGLPVLRSSRPVRFAAQQLVRRAPVNLRPLLRIGKGYNPVTLALVLEACAYLARVDRDRSEQHRALASHCLDELARLRTPGWSGDCWGYDFDWRRDQRLPARTPTVVATGLVVNALAVADSLLELDARAVEMIAGASPVRTGTSPNSRRRRQLLLGLLSPSTVSRCSTRRCWPRESARNRML